ncbi:hypothetical protein [Desertibaculum subflavum]|uniref:hypothetical protein n=1 Tax=Desertibaculum subflavum TaxID=2268458 RepID=UPI000E6633D1
MSDEDDRTTAFGLFNFAHSYWQSAVALKKADVSATHSDEPVTFLYCHAVELYLKAFLRAAGLSVKELRDKYGHNVVKLADAAREDGLEFQDEDSAVIELIAQMGPVTLRYLRTGYFRRPALEALNRTCRSFHESVARLLVEQGHKIRPLTPIGLAQ